MGDTKTVFPLKFQVTMYALQVANFNIKLIYS